jgi:3-oxoacyl-[acyl-carrier protein] reductase
MSGGLQGKVALVTGSSRGIGRAIARRLALDGAEVVVTARGLAAAEEAVREIAAAGGKAAAFALDVSDDRSVEAVTADLLKRYGTIPLLVNNAGITRDNLLLRMKRDDWDLVIGTNLTGIYRTCRALVPSMIRARYGRIVNVTSVIAHVGNPGQANYAATKAGAHGFTRSLAREIASRNVTVNCVAPGFIDTDMTRALTDEARDRLLAQVPLGRLGTPEDVAAAVRFLVGEDASYVTGAVLDVNGGLHM